MEGSVLLSTSLPVSQVRLYNFTASLAYVSMILTSPLGIYSIAKVHPHTRPHTVWVLLLYHIYFHPRSFVNDKKMSFESAYLNEIHYFRKIFFFPFRGWYRIQRRSSQSCQHFFHWSSTKRLSHFILQHFLRKILFLESHVASFGFYICCCFHGNYAAGDISWQTYNYLKTVKSK